MVPRKVNITGVLNSFFYKGGEWAETKILQENIKYRLTVVYMENDIIINHEKYKNKLCSACSRL